MADLKYSISYGFDDTIQTTRLGFAANKGNLAEVQQAIANGIDWREEKHYPLLGALFGGQSECAELLLKAGSPVNAYVLYVAMRATRSSFFRQFLMRPEYGSLLDKSTATSCLSIACEREKDLVEFFLQYGADPNDDKHGHPLFLAASHFKQEILELLLNHGAQINHTGRSPFSALRMLVSSGNKSLDPAFRKAVYEFMISRGAIAIPPFTPEEEQKAREGKIVSIPIKPFGR